MHKMVSYRIACAGVPQGQRAVSLRVRRLRSMPVAPVLALRSVSGRA